MSRKFTPKLLLAAAALPMLLAGCAADKREMTGRFLRHEDVQARHPIVLTEGPRILDLHIGTGRGLTPSQRGDIAAFAREWFREGTAQIEIAVPRGALNSGAAQVAAAEARQILVASGIPAGRISHGAYRAPNPAGVGVLKLTYAAVKASVPHKCGQWPDDLGPSIDQPSEQNRSYWNFGCAYQQNIAAQIANPEDLVRPRGETAPDPVRRNVIFDKYRKGEETGGKTENKIGVSKVAQ